MEEQKVSFETAQLAKEKGFSEITETMYVISVDGYSKEQDYGKPYRADDTTIVRPTQSLLAKWLREIHNIEVLISRIPPEAVLSSKNGGKNILRNYNCYVWNYNSNPRILNNGSFNDIYEEAFEIGLQEGLKLI